MRVSGGDGAKAHFVSNKNIKLLFGFTVIRLSRLRKGALFFMKIES